jgi:urease accessory protein
MIVIDQLPQAPEPQALAGRERDALSATWEERRWTRRRARTRGGRELALALPTGSVLAPGMLLIVGPDFYVEVEAVAEPVIAVAPLDRDEAVRVAFDVGNRHFPMALDGERLLVPDDSAMAQLLERLAVPWQRTHAVFQPIGAGHSHGPGHAPADGHTHHDHGSGGHAHGA